MNEQDLRDAYIAGYRACLYDYAVHRDGELQVGVQRKPHKAVSAGVPNDRLAMSGFGVFVSRRLPSRPAGAAPPPPPR